MKGINMKRTNGNGLVIYEGASQIDGEPIVCIITGLSRKSSNPKTGSMLQSFIMKSNINPYAAWKTSCDKSICGSCFHRKMKTCYVNVAQSPNNVYKTYLKNSYSKMNDENIILLKDKHLRIGSYGDPGAVPFEVWEKICKNVSKVTGYTHLWKTCDIRFSGICMASVDTPQEAIKAQEKGWRTFRIVQPWEKKEKSEVVCPASVNKNVKCNRCLACGGLSSKRTKNIIIKAHGSFGKALRLEKIMKLRKNKKKFTHLVPNI